MKPKNFRFNDYLRYSYCDFSLSFQNTVREKYNSPSELFQNYKTHDLTKKQKQKIETSEGMDFSLKEQELRDKGIDLLVWEDDDYPVLLRDIYAPPMMLFVLGNRKYLNSDCIGVVGSRRYTPYGRSLAEDFSHKLSSNGITVVSGLAAGIDSFAHKGALKGGATIGVMATGIDLCYPAFNISLKEHIARSGCVITESYPGLAAAPFRFPIRNRLISGLSRAVIVIEARIRSGSLITARTAIEQGRDVYAIPGDINRISSEGTNYLIKSAMAFPLLNISEIIGEDLKGNNAGKLNEQEMKVLNLVKESPIGFDGLMETTGFDFGKLSGILFKLEFENLILKMANNAYRGVDNGY